MHCLEFCHDQDLQANLLILSMELLDLLVIFLKIFSFAFLFLFFLDVFQINFSCDM